MYGEMREPGGRTPRGDTNLERLDGMSSLLRKGFDWLSIERLIADDMLIRNSIRGMQSLLAYEQSWLIVHYLMSNEFYIKRFRDYLKAIRERQNADSRLADARAAWATWRCWTWSSGFMRFDSGSRPERRPPGGRNVQVRGA